jgi:hypothetical protein
MGLTNVASPFTPKGNKYPFGNATFCLSNAATSAGADVTFCDYELKGRAHHETMTLRDIATVCALKPGQATNLVLPLLPSISTHDITWRIRLTSGKYNGVSSIDRLPDWLQDAAKKVIPSRWVVSPYEPNIVSDWVTNHAEDFSQVR